VVEELTSRGIGFRSLTEGLHTEGPMGTAMLTIMAAFAQLERDTMIERTRAGLLTAAANGRKGGRPRKVDDADAAKAVSFGRRASRPPISRRCWESLAPPYTATSPMVRGSQDDCRYGVGVGADSVLPVGRACRRRTPPLPHEGHNLRGLLCRVHPPPTAAEARRAKRKG